MKLRFFQIPIRPRIPRASFHRERSLGTAVECALNPLYPSPADAWVAFVATFGNRVGDRGRERWVAEDGAAEDGARAEGGEQAGPKLSAEEAAWLARFHAGDKKVIEEVYLDHFDTVQGAVGRVLRGADQETVVHEVFFRVVSDEEFRMRFHGGSLRAWLATVGRNRAIDFLRRRNREEMTEAHDLEQVAGTADADRFVEQAEARKIVERFRREQLPEKWRSVFEARFMRQLSQREAAVELGISRTTLAYQELRIRSLLKSFLLNASEDDA